MSQQTFYREIHGDIDRIVILGAIAAQPGWVEVARAGEEGDPVRHWRCDLADLEAYEEPTTVRRATPRAVATACEALTAEGVTPTLSAVRARLGGGSLSTLAPLVRTWRAAHEAPTEPLTLAAAVATLAAAVEALARAVEARR